MDIGLWDMDGHNFPNLALMKLSAYHKKRGDVVEMIDLFKHYDKVYVSKVFGDEYTVDDKTCVQADEILYGGSGYAISIDENGREAFDRSKEKCLPENIEHLYPDYSLYPQYTADTAYGFLTRGCPNNCAFCIVSKKEGTTAHAVADLHEFWSGQSLIKLMDGNILACKDREKLLSQLIDSKAKIDFTQGLDARFVTKDIAKQLSKINKAVVHFAFDFMKNEKAIIAGLKNYAEYNELPYDFAKRTVYVLTNYDTTFDEDMYRIRKIKELGYAPYVMVYRRKTAPLITHFLQRWSNNRWLYASCPDFKNYIPRTDGKSIGEMMRRGEI